MHRSKAATQLRSCQYLYFCTSKASKLSTDEIADLIRWICAVFLLLRLEANALALFVWDEDLQDFERVRSLDARLQLLRYLGHDGLPVVRVRDSVHFGEDVVHFRVMQCRQPFDRLHAAVA